MHLIIFIPEKVGFLCCSRERTKIPLKGSGKKKRLDFDQRKDF